MNLSGLIEIFMETAKGKSYGRYLANRAVRGVAVSGRALEVGRGHVRTRPSHWRFLDDAKMKECLTVDIDPSLTPDVVADVCDRLPFEDGSFDTLLCFNLLEHLADPRRGLAEMRRVLKPRGSFVGCVPFLVSVHGDPHDYARYTETSLRALLEEAGFSEPRITPIGGPFNAGYSQIEDLLPRALRLLLLPGVLAAEACARAGGRNVDARWPVNYIFTAE